MSWNRTRGSVVITLAVASLGFASPANAQPSTQASKKSTAPAAPAAPLSTGGKTLSDAFEAAIQRSETLGIQHETLIQAQEGQVQARGAVLPTVSGYASYLHNELPAESNYPALASDQRTTKISLDQPLFKGLKEYAGIRQKAAQTESATNALRAAARQLFTDLATAYYNVLALKSDEANYLQEIDVNRKRLGELKHFLQIGRSRETELLTFQSNISSLETQLETTRGQLEIAKETLAYLTGWDRDQALSDASIGANEGPKGLSEYLARIEDRPDVRGASADLRAAKEGVPIARAGHLPSLDLLGDYYHDRPGGIPSGGNDWDVQLVLSVPIYQGGIVSSQIRQAQSQVTQAELTLSQKKRLAEQEIRSDYDAYSADLRQIAKLEDNVNWSKKAADAQVHDYRNGLVTNLDVLQAITAYQDAQRLLDRQRVLTRADLAKLEAAAQMRPEVTNAVSAR